MNSYDILKHMSVSFENKVDKDFFARVQFDFKNTGKTYFLTVKEGKVILEDDSHGEADVILKTTEKVLNKIYKGEITAFTAAGKAHVSEPAPLDWELKGGFVPEKMKDMYFFIMHFFNTTKPEKIQLGERYSRKVHGGHAIPLYYYPGFRSAWYMVKKWERINEPGDVDPFHQAIVVIKGKGYAKIGEDIVEISENESYYIPPNSDQVIWNESEKPLELIWLAWGEGA